jgi:hypothetical protein
MSDQYRARDAYSFERLVNERCLAGGRSIDSAVRPVAPTVTGPVDHNDAVARSEPVAQRHAHIHEIAAGAVQQHHRLCIRGSKLNQVNTRRPPQRNAPTADDPARCGERHTRSARRGCQERRLRSQCR